MVLVLNDLSNCDEFTKIIIYVCHGISLICLIVVISIYLLNWKRMNTIMEIARHPTDLPRAKCIVQATFFLLILQIMTVVQTSMEEKEQGSRSKKFWFKMLSVFSLLCFYMWCLGPFLLMVLLMKYLVNVMGKFKMVYFYLVSYILPIIITVVMVTICCLYGEEFTRIYWKWILMGFQLIILILMTLANIYSIALRVFSLMDLKIGTKAQMKRIIRAKKIRNAVTLELIMIIIWMSNLTNTLADGVTKANVCVIIFFDSLLGPYFLLYETIMYAKKLLRPFRYQRRKKVIKHSEINVMRLKAMQKV